MENTINLSTYEPDRKGFVFQPSYWDYIEDLTLEEKGMAITAIAKLAFDGEIDDFDNKEIKRFIKIILPTLSASTKRYEMACAGGKIGGEKGGRPRKAEPDTVMLLKAEGKTNSEIATMLDCSTRTVERAVKEATKPTDKTTDDKNLNKNINTNNNVDKNRQMNSVCLSPIEGAQEPVKGRTLQSVLPALEGMGKGQEWVEVALTLKQEKDWVANGYGLLLIPSFQEQVDKALSKREEVAVKQNEIARAFNETLGAERLVVSVEKKDAEEQVQLIDMGNI